MRCLVSLFALAAVLISLFAFTSSTPVSAHSASVYDTCQVGCAVPVSTPHSSPSYVRGNCWSASCYNQDPGQMQCLTNVAFHPYKQPEYYNGVVVGYITSVYSYNCNSNWDEAELTSYATNQGWSVRTVISVIVPLTTSTGDLRNRGTHLAINEIVPYPEANSSNGTTSNGIVSSNGILTYNGATGWPAVSNMVDGSGTTHSEFVVFDGSGTAIFDDNTIQQ